VRNVASKVRLREDTQLDKLFEEGHMPARARIQTTSGRKLEQMILDAKGSPGAPSSSSDIDEKFRSQVADILGTERCEQLIRLLRGIESIDDMAKVPPMLVKN